LPALNLKPKVSAAMSIQVMGQFVCFHEEENDFLKPLARISTILSFMAISIWPNKSTVNPSHNGS
jgi:hypothetical protein